MRKIFLGVILVFVSSLTAMAQKDDYVVRCLAFYIVSASTLTRNKSYWQKVV